MIVLDVHSWLVVGWAMDEHRDEPLVEALLRMALGWREPDEGLLHHSDRGSQYTSRDYQAFLAKVGIQVSMSGTGNCYDIAMMESFFSSLKTECVNRQLYRSRAQAKQSIFEWIEVFYNRQRRHSSLDYVSPVAYEQQPAGSPSLMTPQKTNLVAARKGTAMPDIHEQNSEVVHLLTQII